MNFQSSFMPFFSSLIQRTMVPAVPSSLPLQLDTTVALVALVELVELEVIKEVGIKLDIKSG